MQLSEDIPELTGESLCDRNYDNIVGCIRQLSYTDQEILHLSITLGMGYSEILSVLHISNAAARQRFQHAKDSLAKLLEKEGIFNG